MEIRSLQVELENMQAFLKDLSGTKSLTEQEKCWMNEVCELSYDIDDNIDEFMLHVEQQSSSKPRGIRGFIERYFIVVDDIWDATAWTIIRCALPDNKNGSRIIATTRIETVARTCSSNQYEYVYKIKALGGIRGRIAIVLTGICCLFQLRKFVTYWGWHLRIPMWIGKLHSLYHLQLFVKELLKDDIRILAQLSFLTSLNMIIQATPKENIVISNAGLSALKHLEIRCSRMSYMIFEAGAMPSLRMLEIRVNASRCERTE
ncbi:hypothetical protein PR202_gb24602 [Eleusine coracana subsp. coracana]|uniref:NB-ARC domain-containing protein n=1 Tax=Eleusine coracana subsp. coracana TaxID=191504 RepID=A0AAV5FLV6_ELECO|nr:hypothetical protein PR202_gb24602 [Eleusine coracana subsp. coracana]